MSKFRKIDLSGVKTVKFDQRPTKAEIGRLGIPFDPDKPLGDFLDSLPGYLKAEDLLKLASSIAEAKREGKSIIFMMGAHPLKVGLSAVIIDLVENGFISHLAVNGAFIIHDVELAFFGRTSEEVAEGIADGSFGMVEETPALIFDALRAARPQELGLGEAMGRFISEKKPRFAQFSVAAACYDNDIPMTVHAAVGTDTISQHPGFDGALFGELSHDDFLLFCQSVTGLSGGVVVNVGSAVILPEVFLKALTVARNIHGGIADFVTANLDMIQHYRPNANVVTRPLEGRGRGYGITGHHEIMLPLLAAAVKHNFRKFSREI